MDAQQDDKLKTIGYSGIFLSCYSDYSEKCIHATPETRFGLFVFW